jgi:hypothetical protein
MKLDDSDRQVIIGVAFLVACVVMAIWWWRIYL